MDKAHRSDWVSAWLTPLQASVLESFFATAAGQQFYLTGGTALAAFHLHHRASVDLDLFTLDDLALREADILLPQLAASMNCRLGAMRRTEHYREVFLILRAGYSFDDLLAKAQTKDLGLHPFYLAGSLRQVRNFRRLPATTPPLTLSELQYDMLVLADRLLDQEQPGGNA